MTMAEIRKRYGVPAKRGMEVTDYYGRRGRITSAYRQYILVRLHGCRQSFTYHPTWKLTYHTPEGDQRFGYEEPVRGL